MVVKKGRTEETGKTTTAPVLPAIAPPRPSRWQLVTSGVLVAVWIVFLAWMAFTG